MKPIYVKGLLAGVAGGIAISAIIVLQTAFNTLILPFLYPGSGAVPVAGMATFISLLVPFLAYGLYGLLLLLTGALAVWLARSLLSDYREALIVSGVAGVVAGLLWIAANLLVGVINMLLIAPSIVDQAALAGETMSGILGLLVATDVCCCGPVFLVAATALAMIGGGLCGLIAVKK